MISLCLHEIITRHWNIRLGIVVMDFDCYTGDCSSIPTHDDSLSKWMNLCPSQPMLCEGNWEVNPRCWREINLHNVYNWENGLLRLSQFNQIEKFDHYTFVLHFLAHRTWKTMKYYCFMSVLLHLTFVSLFYLTQWIQDVSETTSCIHWVR